MFGNTKTLELQIRWLQDDVKLLNDRYWELKMAHGRLLDHLGLNEVQVPSKIQLRKKNEKES